MVRRILGRLLPLGSARRKLAKNTLQALGVYTPKQGGYYNTWAHQQYDQLPVSPQYDLPADAPLISVVVPVYNPPPAFFYEMVYSIVSQAYPNWELVIVNASTTEESRRLIAESAQIDTRIRVINYSNKGIAQNTNKGIEEAKGAYVAFVDHDDTVDPFALQEVAKVLIAEGADLVYTDEDKISEAGDFYFDPHFKPGWSPDLLTHVNYINHLTVIRKSVLDKVGRLSTQKDGAQDYDLVLRVTDATDRIHHIPQILYHWRAAQNSTATNFSSKRNITKAGEMALEEHFKRKHLPVKVTAQDDRPGFYDLHIPAPAALSIVVAPFASVALLRLYVELLCKRTATEKVAVELIVPDGAQLRKKQANVHVTVLPAGDNFVSRAVHDAKHENVIILNQVQFPVRDDWLEKMGGLLGLQHVGAVSPLIIRDSAVVEDCGLVRGADSELHPLFVNEPYRNNQTFFGNTGWVRDVDALSGGFTLVRKHELMAYINKHRQWPSTQQLIRAFTSSQSAEGRYNMIYSDVLFDNYSIRIKPPLNNLPFFNENLLQVGTAFEIYTPETVAINILLSLQEQQEIKDAQS